VQLAGDLQMDERARKSAKVKCEGERVYEECVRAECEGGVRAGKSVCR
jgi:hypothetical protein